MLPCGLFVLLLGTRFDFVSSGVDMILLIIHLQLVQHGAADPIVLSRHQ